MMMQSSSSVSVGKELKPLFCLRQSRLHCSFTKLQKQRPSYGDGEQNRGSMVLIVRCARGRKTLKNKRHVLHPPMNHVQALVSALSTEDTDHCAALEYHSKSMEIPDWFTLLEELGKRDLWLLTLEVFRWMQQQKWYKPDDGFYAKIISILGKKGQLRLAAWLFREMKKHGCRPDSSVFNALINAYLRNINNKELALGKALRFYEQMKKTSYCQPNLVTYNMLLRACAQAKQTQKLEDLFKEMELAGFKPDTYTFNGILDAHGKAGDFLEMELVLKKMRQNKVEADFITFNTLIDAYGKAGIIVKMEEALKGMAAAKVKPQLSTFNALINNYGSAKRVDEMELVFNNMVALGVPPTLITYEVLMKGYGNSGCFDKMRRCLDKMYTAGLQPEATTLNAVMEAYCNVGLLKEAESLLDNASILGVEPTRSSYLILHKGYSKHRCTDKVEALLKKMEAAGIKPNDKFLLQSLESVTLESEPRESSKAGGLNSRNDSRKAAGSSSHNDDSSKAVLKPRESSKAGSLNSRNDSREAVGSSSRSDDSSKAVLLHA
eukprot:c14524_g1_i1 orf=98-1744(+)